MYDDKKLLEAFERLPHRYWDFKAENTKEFTHGLHAYPGTMISHISRNLIRMARDITPIHSLLDPFSGSGTVLVESMLAGIEKIDGNDINPLAVLISKVKTTPLDMDVLERESDILRAHIETAYQKNRVIDKADDYIEGTCGLDITQKSGWGSNAHVYLESFCKENGVPVKFPEFKSLGYWFRPYVVLSLSVILEEIRKTENKDVLDFFLLTFSECMRLVSNKRNGEFKLYRIPNRSLMNFHPDVFGTFYDALSRNIKKMRSFCSVVGTRPHVTIYRDDVRELCDLEDNSYDLVVTSPPYGDSRTTVAYGDYSKLAILWGICGNAGDTNLDRKMMGGSVFYQDSPPVLPSDTLSNSLNRLFQKNAKRAGEVSSFYDDLNTCIASVAAKSKPGSYQFWVVGNRVVCDELLRTDIILKELAESSGLVHIQTVGRGIYNKHLPYYEIHGNPSDSDMEHIIALRKE